MKNEEIGWGDDLCSCESQLERLKKNNSDLQEKLDKTTKALKELFALVNGEHPSLVQSQCDGQLNMEIKKLLSFS